MRLRQLDTALAREGWQFTRQRGSHRVYRDVMHGTGVQFVVTAHGAGDLPDHIMSGLARDIRRAREQRERAIMKGENGISEATAAAAPAGVPATLQYLRCKRCEQTKHRDQFSDNSSPAFASRGYKSALCRECWSTVARAGADKAHAKMQARRKAVIEAIAEAAEATTTEKEGTQVQPSNGTLVVIASPMGEAAGRHEATPLAPAPDGVMTVAEWAALEHVPSAFQSGSLLIIPLASADPQPQRVYQVLSSGIGEAGGQISHKLLLLLLGDRKGEMYS